MGSGCGNASATNPTLTELHKANQNIALKRKLNYFESNSCSCSMHDQLKANGYYFDTEGKLSSIKDGI